MLFRRRHKSFPSLVIIEDPDLLDATLRFVNNFNFLAYYFRTCSSYTIKILSRLNTTLRGRSRGLIKIEHQIFCTPSDVR